MSKRQFVITVSDGEHIATEVVQFDPCDIYDASLASQVRGIARKMLGLTLDGERTDLEHPMVPGFGDRA